MHEVWLRTNRRVLYIELLAAVIPIGIGLLLLLVLTPIPGKDILGGLLAGGGLLAAGRVVLKLRQPRLAYRQGSVLFYVAGSRPVAVPVEAVEGFLLGQGPSYLPGKEPAKLETATLVARLSQRYPEWERAEANSSIASWCGHYVTLRGTWCEPLTLDVVNRLNARLAEVSRSSQRVAS